jgi:hypothetical protein
MNRIVFTHHAKERVYEFRLTVKQAIRLLLNAEKEKDSLHLKRHLKYGRDTAITYRNGTYLFMVLDQKDKFTGEDISLVVTMCDQRINLKT